MKRRLLSVRWWLKVWLALVILLAIAFLGLSGFLGHSMTRVERVAVEESPKAYGLEYQDISFPSAVDELTLYGWLLSNSDSERVIIMVHGEKHHRADPSIDMLGIASGLVEHGYDVIMFDLRGHGESEGSRISAGYYEKRDLLGAVLYAKEIGYERIGVLGFSIGAVTSLLAAAETTYIDAVVSDCAFADLNDMIEPQFRERTSFPIFFLRPLLFMVRIMYGVDFAAIRPVEVVSEIAPRPVFIIHSELDDVVPPDHAIRLHQACAGTQDQLWIAPGAEHVRAYADYPEEYLNKVTAFFDNALE